VEERRGQRQRDVAIREDYLSRALEASVAKARNRYFELEARYLDGDTDVRLARDEAQKRWLELDRGRDAKLAALERALVVRAGPVSHVATVLVEPAGDPEIRGFARETKEIERIAMESVMAHERARGFEPEDVSRLGDGSGFDIRSVGPASTDGVREVRRIEVKGRAGTGESVMLTPNEWLQARRHGEAYWLYVVWDCATQPRLVTVQDPATRLRERIQELVQVKGYRVPGEAISALANKTGDSGAT
jgi:hypothetical protein